MTRLLLICSLGACLLGSLLMSDAAAQTAPATQPADLRVVSFNVRYPSPLDGDHVWPNRRELFIATVRTLDPDLLGLQEVTAMQQEAIAEALADYGTVATGRDDGKRKGEASSIFYRKRRFDLLASGTFWLSKTPEVVGSKGWDAQLPRIATWARLRDRVAQREVLFVNAHFDHVGKIARHESAKLLMQRLGDLAQGAPVVLTGDFNASEDSDAYAALVGPGRMVDAYRAVHPTRQADEASFHGFKGTTAGSRIDWILHSPSLSPVTASIDRTRSPEGRYPSDHYAIVAVLR